MASTTLVDASTLHAHLGDPTWVIVDCRHSLADFSAGLRAYRDGHIAGARFADVESDLAGPKSGRNGRHPLPDPQTFASFLRSLGVSETTQIVAYDAGADMFAARLWFLARWIGHQAVAVLDGGLAAWSAAGYPLTAQTDPLPAPGDIRARVALGATLDANEVLARLHSPSMLLVDARAPDRFAGQNETIDPVAGHIPGAVNRHFKLNFRDDGRFKSAAELRSEFTALGAADAARVVNQCGSGVSASVNELAMEIAGLHGARLYPGSWSEWCADPSRPVA